jgi:hypothetical protein
MPIGRVLILNGLSRHVAILHSAYEIRRTLPCVAGRGVGGIEPEFPEQANKLCIRSIPRLIHTYRPGSQGGHFTSEIGGSIHPSADR